VGLQREVKLIRCLRLNYLAGSTSHHPDLAAVQIIVPGTNVQQADAQQLPAASTLITPGTSLPLMIPAARVIGASQMWFDVFTTA